MFKRTMQVELERQMSLYPVVTLTGPRQSGKTTFVKSCYPNRDYYSLEDPDIFDRATGDPRAFLNSIDFKRGVILDEVQNTPDLLSYIQGMVDDQRVPGSFILTGSHQLQLSHSVSQSLAGRTAILELLPLTINELKQYGDRYTVDEYLLKGFFPAIYEHNIDARTHSRNTIKTLIERDIRQLSHVQNLQAFQTFIKLCAARIGSTLNRDNLANEVGMSQNAIRNWMSLLQASYLTYHLPPYYENLGKRYIKSPKLYFYDVGLASYLLEIDSVDKMKIDKYRGVLFENMVVVELLKYFHNHGQDDSLYFFRDSNQNEVDIILKKGNLLIPVEVKSSATFNTGLIKGLTYFKNLVKDRAPMSFLIYNGDMEFETGHTHVLNFNNIQKMLNLIEAL